MFLDMLSYKKEVHYEILCRFCRTNTEYKHNLFDRFSYLQAIENIFCFLCCQCFFIRAYFFISCYYFIADFAVCLLFLLSLFENLAFLQVFYAVFDFTSYLCSCLRGGTKYFDILNFEVA